MFPGVWSAFRQGEQKIHAEHSVNAKKVHMWCVCVTYMCIHMSGKGFEFLLSVWNKCKCKLSKCSTRQALSAKWLESILHTSLTRKSRRPSSSVFLRFLAWGFYLFKYMHMHTPSYLLSCLAAFSMPPWRCCKLHREVFKITEIHVWNLCFPDEVTSKKVLGLF